MVRSFLFIFIGLNLFIIKFYNLEIKKSIFFSFKFEY